MIKHVKHLVMAMVAVFAVSAACAQQMPELPVDSQVRIGKLDNGLTYYIRHNETPKGQADFYIAQKVGSVLEEDNQRGLAHFLEHMCFNGTKNFPGNSLIDWLESIGVKFGQNLNAYTSIDETVYNISNVPTARTSVQDSCLLILHDWANDLTLDPEEIDKERGVIHQEWRRSMAGTMRIIEKLLPTVYPNNRYGERLPIGTMEVVDNFPPQALRDYYETWYRPDQQGIIVVGDIDVDRIEGKIKEIFSDIEMPANAKERVYFPVEDTPGTIYAIGSDPEQTIGRAELYIKTDALPRELKNTQVSLMMDYITHMITSMLNQRIDELGNKPDAPFAQAGVNYGEFLVAKTKDALTLITIAKGDDILPGIEATYRELLRAARTGFTQGEYDRAKAEYLSRLEKAYNGRETRQSGAYVREYVRNFIDGDPIMSIEDEYQMMQALANMLPVQVINQTVAELVTNDNRVLMVYAPENGTFKIPTEQELAAVVAKVDGETIEGYVDTMKDEPLVPALPAPGKVVSVVDVPQWDAKELTLSNGVKVVVKTTDLKKDEILFGAQAVGGSSAIGDEQNASLIFAPIAFSQPSLGTYTNSDLKKYLQGKQASVDFSCDSYSRELSGSSTVKDLKYLMEQIYMIFTGLTLDPDEYQALQNMVVSVLANQEADPSYIFQKNLNATIYDSPAMQALTSEIATSADRQAIIDIARKELSNAADYTFFFVGDVDVATITPLLEQYVATLPADAANATKAYVPNAGREIKPGSAVDTFTTAMQTPQTWVAVLVTGNTPYTIDNRNIASIAGQILSNRLLKKIREEMGAVYSIGAGCGLTRQGEVNTVLQIPFPMKPEMKQEVLDEIQKMVNDMAQNVSDEELNPIKEFMVKSAIENKERNSPWLGAMEGEVLNGVDTFNGAVASIGSITTDMVKAFMADLLAQGNYRVVVLDPAE